LTALSTETDDVDLLVEIGKRYKHRQEYDTAAYYFDRALIVDPRDPWTHLFFGNFHYTRGKYRKAIKHFKFGAKLLKNESCAYWCLGDAYDALGDFARAESMYKKGVAVDPSNEDAKRRLDRWYQRRKSFRIRDASKNYQAATCVLLCERWLRENPDDLWVMHEYAEMLYKMARYEEAIAVYHDALARFPDRAWAIHNQLGQLHRYRGSFLDAEKEYQKAIDCKPEEAGSYIFLGAVQARQGKLKEAEQTHRLATQCPAGLIDEAYHNLGLVLRGQGRLAEARQCFERAIEIDNDYADAIEALKDVTAALELQEIFK
jgi:tetratricopeptide (TPR) repeat protein